MSFQNRSKLFENWTSNDIHRFALNCHDNEFKLWNASQIILFVLLKMFSTVFILQRAQCVHFDSDICVIFSFTVIFSSGGDGVDKHEKLTKYRRHMFVNNALLYRFFSSFFLYRRLFIHFTEHYVHVSQKF